MGRVASALSDSCMSCKCRSLSIAAEECRGGGEGISKQPVSMAGF